MQRRLKRRRVVVHGGRHERIDDAARGGRSPVAGPCPMIAAAAPKNATHVVAYSRAASSERRPIAESKRTTDRGLGVGKFPQHRLRRCRAGRSAGSAPGRRPASSPGCHPGSGKPTVLLPPGAMDWPKLNVWLI